MDYEQLAEKVYVGVRQKKATEARKIGFTNSEILKLNRMRKIQEFDGHLLFFAIKLIHDHFDAPSAKLSNRQIEILEQYVPKDKVSQVSKKINLNRTKAVEFCLQMYNLIF